MIKKFLKIDNFKLSIVIYAAVFILAWPVASLVNFAIDSSLKASGNMPKYTVSIEECTLENMVSGGEFDGGYISTDGDPQIIITFEKPIYISSVYLNMQTSVNPGEILGYYSYGTMGYSSQKRVIATFKSDVAEFEYGRKKVDSVRLDPTMFAGVSMKFGEITINTDHTFGEYIRFPFSSFFQTLIASTILVSAILIFKDGLNAYYENKNSKN